MNLFEVLQLYNEMADDLSRIENSLRNSENQRIQNLLQIFVWRNSSTINHWCDELYAVCHDVNRTKNKNKYPKEKFILQNIWGCWEDCYYDRIDNYIDDVEIKENKHNTTNEYIKVPKFSKLNFYNFMKDYHAWLAYELNVNGFVSRLNVRSKIQELLNKYSLEG